MLISYLMMTPSCYLAAAASDALPSHGAAASVHCESRATSAGNVG